MIMLLSVKMWEMWDEMWEMGMWEKNGLNISSFIKYT